jgi:acyl-CoA synthetase (AMP-forming)/AMP-acid ligase II
VLRHAVPKSQELALVVPTLSPDGKRYTEGSLTFGELGQRVSEAMAGLAAQGFKRDDRVILMAPLSTDLYALLLGLLASGMSAVFVDTGMGRDTILQAISDARAQAIVSVRALLKYRWLAGPLRRLRHYSADSSGWGVRPLSALFGAHDDPDPRPTVDTHADDHALITFTSGSTGRPKGADRTQGLLVAQHLALADHFPAADGEVDMPCFPVVTLHNLCCGVPTVLPAVDFKAPASVNPAFVFEQIGRWGVTRMSGAPAYIARIVADLERRGATEARIRQLGVGGAPTPISLCERIAEVFPTTEAQVIYGSTEAEPIASVDMGEIVRSREDAQTYGHLVGTVAHAATVALVDLPDPAPDLDDQGVDPYRVAHGEPGELVVSGPHVNRAYLDNPDATRANKLYSPDGVVWHRTGDVASVDAQGRLWLRGRVNDLVRHHGRAIHPLPIEAALTTCAGVVRVALVNTATHTDAVLAVQGEVADADLVAALEALGLQGVTSIRVAAIPMDYRHQSKIDRPTLRAQLEHL